MFLEYLYLNDDDGTAASSEQQAITEIKIIWLMLTVLADMLSQSYLHRP